MNEVGKLSEQLRCLSTLKKSNKAIKDQMDCHVISVEHSRRVIFIFFFYFTFFMWIFCEIHSVNDITVVK